MANAREGRASGATETGGHAAQVDRAPGSELLPSEHRGPAYGRARRPANSCSQHGPERMKDVGLTRLPGRALDHAAVRVEDKHRRSTPDVKATDEVEMRLRVDVDMHDPVYELGRLTEDLPSRPSWCAESGRELHQRGSLPERSADVAGTHPCDVACRDEADPTVAPLPQQTSGSSDHNDRGKHNDTGTHHRSNNAAALVCSSACDRDGQARMVTNRLPVVVTTSYAVTSVAAKSVAPSTSTSP